MRTTKRDRELAEAAAHACLALVQGHIRSDIVRGVGSEAARVTVTGYVGVDAHADLADYLAEMLAEYRKECR